MIDDGFQEFINLYKNFNRKSFRWDNLYEKSLALYNTSIRKKVSKLSPTNKFREEITGCLDLLNAIYEYRRCPDMEVYLARYPDMEFQRKHIDLLWKELELKTPEEMNMMVRDMFREIDMCFGEH
jgi:hypothetical protein